MTLGPEALRKIKNLYGLGSSSSSSSSSSSIGFKKKKKKKKAQEKQKCDWCLLSIGASFLIRKVARCRLSKPRRCHKKEKGGTVPPFSWNY
jgi:hypothetical protein